MSGMGRVTEAGDVDRLALALADCAETDSVNRLRRLVGLRDAIDEAARRADATMRLEHALHYAARR